MIEIHDESDLRLLLKQEHAALFFHAPWSRYAILSKQMVEFVESYAKMGRKDVHFFFGEFEGELVHLAEAVVAAGVPARVAFTGNGSLSFFRRGQHIHTLSSVVGEGTFAVWKHIDELLGKPVAEPSP